jgi:hypothetical protein
MILNIVLANMSNSPKGMKHIPGRIIDIATFLLIPPSAARAESKANREKIIYVAAWSSL